MDPSRFQRMDSGDSMHQSPPPPPVQQIRHPTDPFRDPDGPTPEYRSQNSYQPDGGLVASPPSFTSSLPPWSTAYQPVDQVQEGEKKPGFDRQTTQTSYRSRLSSVSTSKILTPLLTKSWHHGRDKSFQENPSTVRRFSKGRQTRKTFIHGLIQFIPPVIFSVILAVILFIYDRRAIISHGQKYTFNSLVLGLTLLLGFAVQSTFKLYADLMRWRFLAHTYWDLQTFERIMGSSSQRTVLKLLWSARRKSSWIPSRVQVVCFVYLFFAVGLQVVIACLGLCYSVETSQVDVAWARGNMTVVDLTQITQEPLPTDLNERQSFVLQSGAANTYGLISRQLTAIQNPTLESQNSETNAIFLDTEAKRFWYRFNNACSEPGCDVARNTDRTVSANATCKQFPIVSGGTSDDRQVNVTDAEGSLFSYTFPIDIAAGTTSYMSNMDEDCGPRCTTTVVLNVGNLNSNDTEPNEPRFFYCTNTLTEVTKIPNDVDPTPLQLPDTQARIVAGAIGFSGTYALETSFQWRNYPYNSYWSWNFRTDDDSTTEGGIAVRIMRYSMGALAAMDLTGPRVATIGQEPRRAQTVTVKWDWTAVVLISVPGLQFLFLFFVMWFTRGVVIRDGSYLGNARLLRPIVQELGDKGCMLSGDEIAEALDGIQVAYGVRMPQQMGPVTNLPGQQHRGASVGFDTPMHLDILYRGEGVAKENNGWQPGMHMPQGRYDGLHES